MSSAPTITKVKHVPNAQEVEKIIAVLGRTTEEFFSVEELRKILLSGKQLRLKYGVDLTAPHLHIGHAVNLWMYRYLQDLGHKVVFLLGDFTTQIGDPTGRSKTRPVLAQEEIEKNAQAFLEQVTVVLRSDPEVFEIRRNSEWFGRMKSAELLSLLSFVTHDKLISRDMFRARIEQSLPIYMHEMLYPILQGYDSRMLEADLTIVGSDQLFNEMMGRLYQERFGQAPQIIITSVVTPGIDGKEKQSKSLGNYIGLAHTQREKFGRLMSMPDHLVPSYFKVYTDLPLEEIAELEKRFGGEPMQLKTTLAKTIVARYHGNAAGEEEAEWFKKTFSNKEFPANAPQIAVGKSPASAYEIVRASFGAAEKSNSEIRRLFAQNAVSLSGKTISDPNESQTIPAEGLQLKVGKKNWFLIKA